MTWVDWIYLVSLIILLFLSAIFSAMDMAYSSVSTLRLEAAGRAGDLRAQKAWVNATEYEKTISTVLFGNDFVNILASSLATVLGGNLLAKHVGDGMAATISSIILLVLLLIFGEIIPKAIAKSHSFKMSRHFNSFLSVCYVIFFPFVFSANFIAKWVSKPLLKKTNEESNLATDEELQEMVDEIESEGIIDEKDSELLHNSIEFKETSAYEIMTPRVDVVGYDIDSSFSSFLKTPRIFVHSRIPVYSGSLDNVLGYLPVKSLLRALALDKDVEYEDFMLPINSVPRTMNISAILLLMKKTRHHIALVRDEYGGAEGIITLEDILEELVGEMWDEQDKIKEDIVAIGKNTFRVNGKTNIDDFFDRFLLDDKHLDDDYSTVSGWINDKLEKFAQVGDRLRFERIDLTVTEADEFTVEEAIVKFHPRRKIKHE